MTDSIALHIDRRGNVQSLSISTPAKCKPLTKTKKITKVKTHASVKRGDSGPTPFVDNIVEQQRKKEEGGGDEEKGFLQKYVRALPFSLRPLSLSPSSRRVQEWAQGPPLRCRLHSRWLGSLVYDGTHSHSFLQSRRCSGCTCCQSTW